MKKFNYLEILFTGLGENANDIKEFIIRHQKLAKRDNFITSESFYLNMSTEISNLKSEIENIFYNRQNDLNKALDFRKANNENIKVIEDQLNSMKLDDFGLNILRLSEGTFKGHLRYSELQYFEEMIKETSINIVDEKQQIEIDKSDKKYKDEIWFKVGLLFASGEMEKFYYLDNRHQTVFKNEYSAPKVAKELKNRNFNKYILGTINNYSKEKSNANKNIFNSRTNMLKIISFCKSENITIIPYFIERLPKE